VLTPSLLVSVENDVNLGPSAVTTDVEKYLHLIDDCYGEGFTLDKFVRVPGVKMTTDVTDWMTPQPYQAILTRLDNQTRSVSSSGQMC
jgi:hypothetical protein